MEVTVRLVFKTEILAGETMYKSNIDRLNFLWGLWLFYASRMA